MWQKVVATLLLLLMVLGPRGGATMRSREIIRLHVHAHSDTEEEQRLKLAVRDALLGEINRLVSEAETPSQAEKLIERALPGLTSLLQSTLQKEKSPHVGQVKWGVFLFPSRVYGQLALPAGRYRALNVHIGEGNGRNWWCVMYPPLCFVNGVVGQSTERRFDSALRNLVQSLWRRLRN